MPQGAVWHKNCPNSSPTPKKHPTKPRRPELNSKDSKGPKRATTTTKPCFWKMTVSQLLWERGIIAKQAPREREAFWKRSLKLCFRGDIIVFACPDLSRPHSAIPLCCCRWLGGRYALPTNRRLSLPITGHLSVIKLSSSLLSLDSWRIRTLNLRTRAF